MKKLIAILLIAGLMLVGVGLVWAQTGGGFDLTWSTIDGGGGSSSGGDFSLSGTIGQADAGGPLSGGSYTLNGGFWLPVCAVPQAVTDETIQPSSGSVQLSWTGSTTAYNIYRAANDPYFVPGAIYATSGSPWTDPDGAVLGNVMSNYSYLIRASNECGESSDSQRLGEFDFALVPGS